MRAPKPGDWVTFHRTPVYGPECGPQCRKPDGHRGYAEVGRVVASHDDSAGGRPIYQVAYWHYTVKGQRTKQECRVTADRIIHIITQPPGWPDLAV